MFKFLKEKLKGAISKISEGVEKEGKVEEKIVEKPAEDSNKEEKGFFAKLKEKFVKSEEKEKRKKAEVFWRLNNGIRSRKVRNTKFRSLERNFLIFLWHQRAFGSINLSQRG